ncbi:MAG: GAF domain-containing protein [Deltaproteobacteria bacterium]|nr:GAF domain-containing protein [Deltaproteobacteria bacterium]
MHVDRRSAPRKAKARGGAGAKARGNGRAAEVEVRRSPPARGHGNGAETRVRQLEDEIADLRAELERSERRVEAMKQIGRALGSSLALDRVLTEIVTRTTELLEADRSSLFMVDHERRELHSKVMLGTDIREIRLPFGAGIAAWVAEKGEPLHIKNAYADHRFNPDVDKRSGYRTRCMLVWPVRRPHGDQVIGVIQVLNKRTGAFDATDERLLEAIASEIGVSLEVARLYNEAVERSVALEQARSKLMLLIETERAISESHALDAMLRAIIDTALTNLDAKSGVVYLLDDFGHDLRAVAAGGDGAESLRTYLPGPDDPVLSEAMLSGRPVISHGFSELQRGKLKARRGLAAPIIDKDAGTIGVLELLDKRGRTEFTQRDAETLGVVAAQVGRAIRAERGRSERERAERLTAIGRMLAGVVHDLRTPLTLISGYTELMTSSRDAVERKKQARAVQKQIELMTAMTKDLLAFARGERSVLIRKVYVERFVAEMEEYLQRELEGSGVQLEVELGYRGTARFDEGKLRRVFHNIARNAREAMPGGGKFTVRVNKAGDDLVFEFVDTGVGIAKGLEGRVFEPFVTAGKAGGTGLGLAMVKRIAEEHRGNVTFESTPGKGTRFIFTLPIGLVR